MTRPQDSASYLNRPYRRLDPGAAAMTDTQAMAAVDEDDDETTAPPPAPHYLVAEGLTAVGAAGAVFSGVNLRARLGDLVAVLGNAGTGRTALLLALAGRLACSSGVVRVGDATTPRRIRARVAVAQAPPAIAADPHHTVAALVDETRLLGRHVCDTASIERVFRLLDVRAVGGDSFGRLPMADRTLLMVALAAVQRTPVIVVDDVDFGVDSCGAARVWSALRRLADRNHLVIASAVRPDLTPDVVVRMNHCDPRERARARQDATVVVTRVVEGSTP